MPDTLRVGVLVDGFQQPRWVRWVLEEIVALPNVRLVLAVQNQARLAVPRGNRISTLWRNRKHLGYALYSRIDGRRRLTVPDPLQEVAIDDLLAGCATLAVTPRATAACDYISDDDVRAIEGYQLDVALRFGFRILKGAILNAARHGIWSYHHGDHRAYRGGPPAFWEMLDDKPATGAILQVLPDDLDNGRVLDR